MDIFCDNDCRRRERKSVLLKERPQNLWNVFLRAKLFWPTALVKWWHITLWAVLMLSCCWVLWESTTFWIAYNYPWVHPVWVCPPFTLSESLFMQFTFRQLLTFSLPFWIASTSLHCMSYSKMHPDFCIYSWVIALNPFSSIVST